MSEERAKVISLMKACVLSYKGDVTLPSLANDYMTLNGSLIPFKDLGYKTLAQFIESIPEMRTTAGRYGDPTITWESCANTDHIVRMIAAQKPSKKTTKYASDKIYNNPWKKPFKPPTDRSPSEYTKPEHSKYLGKNYDPNYRWKPPAGPSVSSNGYGYRSWDKNAGWQDKKATIPRPRTNNDERNGRYYKGPNPTGPRFNTARQADSESETEENEWEIQRAEVSSSSPVHYKETAKDQESRPDREARKTSPVGQVPRPFHELRRPHSEGLHPLGESLRPVEEDPVSAPDPVEEAEPHKPPPKSAAMMGLTPAQLMQQVRVAARTEGHLHGPMLADLQSFARMVNMAAPLVNVGEHPTASGYACHILVWLFVFESNKPSPSMLSSVEDAAELALNAMNALNIPIEADYNQPQFVINRVLRLVYQHAAGIWKTGILELYAKAYAEQLPDDWVENVLGRARNVAITVISSPKVENEIWKAKLVKSVKVPTSDDSSGHYTSDVTTGPMRRNSMRPIAHEPVVMQPHGGVVRPMFRPPDYVPVFRSGPTNVQPPGLMPARFNPRARLNPSTTRPHRISTRPVRAPTHLSRTFALPIETPTLPSGTPTLPSGTPTLPSRTPTLPSGTPSPVDSSEAISLTPLPDSAGSGTPTPPAADAAVKCEWTVLVLHVASTADVSVRKFDPECNAAYDGLCADMDRFYSGGGGSAAPPVVGKHYAVPTGGGWGRALLSHVGDGNEASVTWIDLGHEAKVNFELCYYLEPRFYSLPPQAMHCALEGMDELREFTEHVPLLVETLVGKLFWAEVMITTGELMKNVSLTLHNHINRDFNINFWLTEKMSEGVAKPALPPVGHTVEAYLTHIEDGEIFVHTVSEAFKYLQALLRQLASSNLHLAPYRVSNVIVNRRRYLAVRPDTGAFVRVVVLMEPDPDGRIIVGYLDYGNIEHSHIDYLYDLGDLAAALTALPPLAMSVVLHGLPPVTPQTAQLLLGLAPPTQAVIVKVVKSGLFPEVELFKRIQPNNMLVSINNTLENDPRIQALRNAQEQARLNREQEVASAFAPVPRARSAAPAIPDAGSNRASVSPDTAEEAEAACPIDLAELQDLMEQLSTGSFVPAAPTTVFPPPGFAPQAAVLPAARATDTPPTPVGSFPTGPTTGFPTGPTTGFPTGPTTGFPTGPTTGFPTGPTTGFPTGQTTGFPTDPLAGILPYPAVPVSTAEQHAYYLHQLPAPVLPPVGVDFDVRVPLVSNPTNFYVQPWAANIELEAMMRNMQEFYGGPRFHQPVNPEDVHPGMAYATQHEDNFWYRVTARNVACNMQVLVSFSDFGDLRVVPLSSLRILDDAFMKLPKQSIKARLYGIKPTYHDWSVADCIYFQRLVNAKLFVSFIHECVPDPEYPNELIVGLTLVDTSSNGQDVHIDKLLVREQRAVLADVAKRM